MQNRTWTIRVHRITIRCNKGFKMQSRKRRIIRQGNIVKRNANDKRIIGL